MAFDIQPMDKDDIDEVIRIGEVTPELETGTSTPDFYGRDTLSEWIEAANGVTLVAKSGDRMAGFILGQALGGSKDAYINCTVVNEEFRGQGIASELTREAEKIFSELGCNHVFSVIQSNNLAMLALKRKLGYDVGAEPMLYVDKMIS